MDLDFRTELYLAQNLASPVSRNEHSHSFHISLKYVLWRHIVPHALPIYWFSSESVWIKILPKITWCVGVKPQVMSCFDVEDSPVLVCCPMGKNDSKWNATGWVDGISSTLHTPTCEYSILLSVFVLLFDTPCASKTFYNFLYFLHISLYTIL